MGLAELAKVVVLQGARVWAARLFGAAEVLREEMGAPLPAVERSEYEKQVAAVRVALGGTGLRTAWARGRNMTPQQACAEREAEPEPESSLAPSHAETDARVLGLTRREQDV